jgi:hypothetical protein
LNENVNLTGVNIQDREGLLGITNNARLFARQLQMDGIVLPRVAGHYLLTDEQFDQFDSYKQRMDERDFRKRVKDIFLISWIAAFRPGANYETEGEFIVLDSASVREYEAWKAGLL